jgi:hypothetical protein
MSMTRIDSSPGSVSSLSRDLGWIGVSDSNKPGPLRTLGLLLGTGLLRVVRAGPMMVRTMVALALRTLMALAPLMIHDPP